MYKEYQPCAPLSPYIDKYWEFDGLYESGVCLNILPDGCTDIIFSFVGDTCTSYFVGPMNFSRQVVFAGEVHMLGIRFQACGLLRFMSLPMPELLNQRLATSDLTAVFDDSMVAKLCAGQNIRERISMIENFLIGRLHGYDHVPDRQVVFAAARINQHRGRLPIRTLMNEVCLCQRHFERKFRSHTGYSPKEYSRIIKFRHAVELMRTSASDDLLAIAVEAGYYDVPHFSKEIRRLSGRTLSSVLSLTPETEP